MEFEDITFVTNLGMEGNGNGCIITVFEKMGGRRSWGLSFADMIIPSFFLVSMFNRPSCR